MKDTNNNKITEEEFTKDIGHRVEGGNETNKVMNKYFNFRMAIVHIMTRGIDNGLEVEKVVQIVKEVAEDYSEKWQEEIE